MSGKLTHLYILFFWLVIHGTPKQTLVQNPLLTIHIFHADYVMSVLAGKTEGFVATHVISGTILIVNVCHQLCVVFTTDP